MRKRRLFWLMGMIILFFVSSITPVKAAGEPTKPETSEAYANAPNGMKLDKFVDIPSEYTYQQNNRDYSFTSSGSLLTNYSTNIIQLITTEKTKAKQIGSFWGKVIDNNGIRTYNYFDLTKDQEISVWIYDGKSDTAGEAIDGFAFVLQNDSAGTQAISTGSIGPTAGQTLGVWGTAAGGGIQNSVALEFDRYPNMGGSENYDNNSWSIPTGEGIYYSRNIKEKHISWNYPGEADSYTSDKVLKHRKTPNQVTNDVPMAGYDGTYGPAFGKYSSKDAWRHLLITYKTDDKGETSGVLTYKFNDKYPDGTNKLSSMVQTGQLNIDTKKFNSTDKKVRWGFTAATGSSMSGIQDLGFVIDKMPAVADVKATVDAHDLTTDKRSSDMGTTTNDQGLTVYKPLETFDGDKIQFEYNLQYIDGLSETGAIKTQVALPENIDYSGDDLGMIGSIIYFDAEGKEIKRDSINKSQIEKVTVTVPGKQSDDPPISKTLDGVKLDMDSLEDPKARIQILINGTAQAQISDTATLTKVGAEHTSYRSENFTGDVISPELTINNDTLVIDRTSAADQDVDQGEKVKLAGTVEHGKGSVFDGTDLVATTQIYDANNDLIRTDTSNVPVLSGSLKGEFSLDTDTSDLSAGQAYIAKVTLRDVKGRVSNTLEYNFNVEDKKLILNLGDINHPNYEKAGDNFIKYEAYYKMSGNNKVDPELTNMTVHFQIDDGLWEEEGITAEQILANKRNFNKYLSNDLSDGPHTIKVYLNDGTRDSNEVTYDFNIFDHALILTPEKREIVVKNNDPVNQKWNIKYDETTGVTSAIANFNLETVQIRNLDQPDMQEFKDFDIGMYMGYPISDVKKDFNFDLYPIAAYASPDSQGQKLLKEGRNEIKLSVSQVINNRKYTSAEETMVINVPKLSLNVETAETDYYTNSKSGVFVMNMKYSYLEDDDYTTELEKYPISLKTTFYYGDNTPISLFSPVGSNSNAKKEFKNQTTLDAWSKVLEYGNTYQIHATVTDPYERASNDIVFNYHLVKDKYLGMKVDDYQFVDIDYDDSPSSLIKRNGYWQVLVESTGSKWNLYAQSDGLTRNQYRKGLVFVDENGLLNDLRTSQLVGSRDTPIKGQSQIDKISWDADHGILLQNDKPDIAGEYSGQINWDLEDVPEE